MKVGIFNRNDVARVVCVSPRAVLKRIEAGMTEDEAIAELCGNAEFEASPGRKVLGRSPTVQAISEARAAFTTTNDVVGDEILPDRRYRNAWKWDKTGQKIDLVLEKVKPLVMVEMVQLADLDKESATVDYNGKTYAATKEAMEGLGEGAVINLAQRPLPDGFNWPTVDKERIALNPQQLTDLHEAVVNKRYEIQDKLWSKEDEVTAASTVAEVLAVTWAA